MTVIGGMTSRYVPRTSIAQNIVRDIPDQIRHPMQIRVAHTEKVVTSDAWLTAYG